MPQVVVEKQQRSQEKLIFAQKGKSKSTAEGHILTSSTSEKQQELLLSKNQSCIEKCRLLRNRVSCSTDACNRTGVSFSFSRKVHLKLESSASVFSENMEEAFDCNGSPRHTVKQTSKECNACLHMSDERKASLQKRLNTLQGHPDSTASCNQAAKNKTLKGNDQNANREQVETHFSFCRDKIQSPECASVPGGKEQGREPRESKRFSETIVPSQYQMSNVSMQQNTYKHSDVLLAERIFELSAQRSPEQGHLCEVNYSPCVFKANGSSESSKAANANTEIPRGDALVHEIKPKALPFLHVLSKDGSTALRWPTELLLFTKTEPSISYGCNPLYFDFKLSLSHRDNEHHEANTGSCKEHSKAMDIDGNEASGLPENKQLSNEQDNQSLKPKKKKRALSLKRPQPNLDSDPENETNQSAPKYISEELNENLPQVPAQLNCSQRHCTRATSPHRNIPVRSLAPHLQSCEKTLRDEVTENICIYPLVSRTKMQKCVQCEFMYSQRKDNPDLVTTCSSDISDSGKDSILGYPFGSPEKCVENEGKPSFAGCWKFSSLQKSSADRQSNYSDTSVSSATSYISCYSSHRSSDQSRSHLAFCCKRKQKPVERQKCKHKKHNCISSSDDADEDCLFDNKSQRSRNCTQRQTVKYQRHSRYRHLLQRDISKPSRNRHPLCKHSRSRSYSSSKGSSIRDSGSSERSLSCTRSKGSRSGSLAKESMYSWNQHKEEMKSNYGAESGKSDAARSDCRDGSCLSKHAGACSINHLGRESVGQEKSLTAKLLLEKVKSKKNQEQLQNMGGFSNACRIDLPYSQLGIKCGSPLESEAAFLLPEKALNINTNSVWNNETRPVESSADKAKAVATVIKNGTLTASTNYSNCLLQDLIQRGTGYQAPSVEMDAAIKEHSSILTDEKQCSLQSGDPVPNGFPGAFPLNSHPLVPNAMETKEHSASANWNQVEGDLSSYSDSPMHKHNDTESKTELYSKCISSPLTQQPITFSPDEIDKYRFLQLQAQQHMQKQLVAKHFKVLPTTGPAAFSASPAVHPLPVQQHASVATLHQTLLQSFALSAAVHPHSSHLSVTHIHPFPPSHFAPISLSPFTPAFMPMHAALLSGHPFRLVSASPIHSSHLTIPPLPHAAFLPTLFAPQLNAAASSAIHLNPLIHPFFQGQELQHHS